MGVALPDGLKFRFLYQTGMELLTPDMGVEFLHGGNGCDFNGSVVKVGDVVGAAAGENVNGTEGQPLMLCVHLIEDDRWFSLRCALPKEFDVLDLNTAPSQHGGLPR